MPSKTRVVFEGAVVLAGRVRVAVELAIAGVVVDHETALMGLGSFDHVGDLEQVLVLVGLAGLAHEAVATEVTESLGPPQQVLGALAVDVALLDPGDHDLGVLATLSYLPQALSFVIDSQTIHQRTQCQSHGIPISYERLIVASVFVD